MTNPAASASEYPAPAAPVPTIYMPSDGVARYGIVREDPPALLAPVAEPSEDGHPPLTRGRSSFFRANDGSTQSVNPIVTMFERCEMTEFENFGGMDAICRRFKSDAVRGPDYDAMSIEQRREVFGVNKLPPAKEVTFIELVINALSDHILLMLIAAAVVQTVIAMTVVPAPRCKSATRTPTYYTGMPTMPTVTPIDTSTPTAIDTCLHYVPDVTCHTTPEWDKGWLEGAAILISVSVVVLVSSWSDYAKARKFAELEKAQPTKMVRVMASAAQMEAGQPEWIETPEFDVVCGQIIELKGGAIVPADCIFVSGQDLETDESAMTGESDTKKKSADGNRFLTSGSPVVQGHCRAMVVAVGEESFSGVQTMQTREEEPEGTPLQQKLERMAKYVGYFGSSAALLTFITLTILEVIAVLTDEHYANYKQFDASTYLDFIIITVAIIVVAIPEGLPLAVTISLAFGMNKMMDDKCNVRHLAACETMGAGTAICSDKTGTLTTNEMMVVQGWLGGASFADTSRGVPPMNEVCKTEADTTPNAPGSDVTRRVAGFCIALNSDPDTDFINDRVMDSAGVMRDTVKWLGNKTEGALLRWVQAFGTPFRSLRVDYAINDGRRYQYPFSSLKKRITTVVRMRGRLAETASSAPSPVSNLTSGASVTSGGAIGVNVAESGLWEAVVVTGASELVLEDCDMMFNGVTGQAEPLTDSARKLFDEIIAFMADAGNRTLAVAYHETQFGGRMDSPYSQTEPDPKLCLVALVGIQDPIRPEVPAAVAQCKAAGVTVRMVTGDNIQTAISIAKKCGIFDPATGLAMEGKTFRALAADDPDRLQEILPRLQVLARSSPQDKYVLCNALKTESATRKADVVAMTGDGTNDAPALKLANVGFAMNSGTEIARAASDIVLLDDNFVSVVKACNWGRNVNDNVRKFIQFQLTVNCVGVLLTFFGAVFSPTRDSPLSAVQLLWTNLIMDTFAALALATELPSPIQLTRSPVYLQAPLISRRMWAFILIHGVYQFTLLMLWLHLSPLKDAFCAPQGSKANQTIVFNTFIFMQIVNQFNARSLYDEWNLFAGMHRSIPLIFITFIEIGFQCAAVMLPGFQDVMGTTTLDWKQWLVCLAAALVHLPLNLVVKFLPIPEKDYRKIDPPPKTVATDEPVAA